MTSNTYTYTIVKGVKGIHIRIGGTLLNERHDSSNSHGEVKIDIEDLTVNLTEEEVIFLTQGVLLLEEQIGEQFPGQLTTVKLTELDFHITQFQPEALVPALAFWTANTIGVPPPEFRAEYNPQTLRYTFSSGSQKW